MPAAYRSRSPEATAPPGLSPVCHAVSRAFNSRNVACHPRLETSLLSFETALAFSQGELSHAPMTVPMTLPKDPIDALANAVKPAWQRFLDVYEPVRHELYRYCRYLTKSPWDAEDLVQDTLARAFATLGCLFQPPPKPRAWMFRVAFPN
jgi:hypothetical protein